ncbi:ABC transporter ATP-binding protein [Streptomyces sp. NPDC003077]|uniref:ABC transporter ATP-binding protein n=1 Tax=Streptomyces sp. NPDC003077 TaxID=3154443 RepID=UPI0033A473A6
MLLFGGPLRYDVGWTSHDDAFLHLSLFGMVRRLPGLLAQTARLAHRADRRALGTVVVAEVGRGGCAAGSLLAVNQALATLLGGGLTTERLRAAVPAIMVVAVLGALSALLRAASIAGTGRLEPKVERLATESYLEATAAIELEAIEDDEFHRTLDSAQYGAGAARRMIKQSTSVISALVALVAAGGVLSVLHVALLPMLVLMTVPSAWATLITARRRYVSFKTWTQHARAGRLIASLLISPHAAPEVRLHGVGRFLLRHFRAMSQTYEGEQSRLAKLAARTGLIGAACTGAAALGTFATLGLLLWSGAMALSAAGTAVLAIRSGAGSLSNLALQVNALYEEGLFVQDLQTIRAEAARRRIPTGGIPVPKDVREIRFENVSFTYPGTDNTPALHELSLTIPLGKVIAIVGRNGSGKTTLVKLLAGLYQPGQGRILWDNLDAAALDREQLFARIATVGQDFHRWPFTARVNIGIGRPDAPPNPDRLREAAQYADAEELLDELPRGLDTLLARGYQGGHQLSGGQWQRLGIARARFRHGDILIVDEPTAALDPEAEQAAFAKIRAGAQDGQTVILITHRLYSVRHADFIHVLDHGRLSESGTFEELMAARAGFHRMYERQRAQYQPASSPPT